MKDRIKKIIPYWPEALVLLLCGILLIWNIGDKKGYHMDELLSFELANAEFNPWIVPTQPQGRLAKFVQQELRGDSFGETCSNLAATVKDVLKNRGGSRLLSYTADVYEEPVWIDKKTFVDYITVGDEDAFNYLSVYFNVKDDNHPPLHFMVLHTVSSLFRGKIAPIMGCGINLLCVLGVMILLMRLAGQYLVLLGHGEWGRTAGIFAALLYGLSAGALSTVLLIRMYAMLTFFCVALLEIHVRKGYREEFDQNGFERGNGLLILVTLLGFWTQYFFLFFCLILAAVTAVILWREKRKKELWRYVRSMVTAAVIGVLVFPFSISDVFSSGRGVEALENLSSGFSGYGERLAVFLGILAERAGIACVPALFLGIVLGVLYRLRSKEKRSPRTASFLVMLILPTVGYFLLAARMSPYQVDRYLMPIFPTVLLVLALLFWEKAVLPVAADAGGRRAGKIALAVVVAFFVILQFCSRLRYGSAYFYPDYGRQEKIAEEYAEYPCICIYQGVGYYENLPEFTRYERTLLLTAEELKERKETQSVRDLEEVVVILKGSEELDRTREVLRQKYGLREKKCLQDIGEAGGDMILLFEREGS